MPLSSAYSASLTRLQEARNFHISIVGMENVTSSNLLSTPTEETLIMRGLFYVILYGVWEFSVTQMVQYSIQYIVGCQPHYTHIKPILHSIVLDS